MTAPGKTPFTDGPVDAQQAVAHWARRMRAGELHARIQPLPAGPFQEIAADLNALAEDLQRHSQHIGAQVRAQTTRISYKTRSLDILYEVVASLTTARTQDGLLADFLNTLVELLDASAASIGFFQGQEGFKIVASHGDLDQLMDRWSLQPRYRRIFGDAILERRLKIHRTEPADEAPELIVVPIQYHDSLLGLCTILLEGSSVGFGSEFRDLLTSVGRHVGLALEKARLEKNARRLAIMEERDILRSELHDSLAQSLVSMRLQVKMLGEILHRKDTRAARNEVRRLKMALDEAHTSLRELLTSFRTSMDARGLVPAIEDSVTRFGHDTGITALFQNRCNVLDLSPAQEVEMFRIVQEALANIRKHSQANTVRILLSDDPDGGYRLLVEDDGVGMGEETGEEARRFGLDIMRERAKRLNARLEIESEPGEGTRIALVLDAPGSEPVAL